MTHGTYGALAVTGADDYVEGFLVSGMDEGALARSRGRRRATARSARCARTACRSTFEDVRSTRARSASRRSIRT